MSDAVACPLCEAKPGERCKLMDGSPAQTEHMLRRYAAQMAGLEPRGYIPVDQQRLLDNPELLAGYRARRRLPPW